MHFRNKSVFIIITVYLVQTVSYVTEMAKENYILKFLNTSILHLSNKEASTELSYLCQRTENVFS